MKTKSIKGLSFVLLIVCVAVLALFCSCDKISGKGQIKVTDLTGREVVLEKPANRIVALAPTDCEILADINCLDKIVARGTYCDYPEAVKDIKDVGSGELTNIEEIVALQPDLVMTSKAGFTVDQINKLEQAGLKVLVNEANTFDDIYKYIAMCGKVTGHEADADGTIAGMRTAILEFRAYTNEYEPKTVYFQICDFQYGYWTAGKNTYLNEMVEMINCTNVFGDMNGWVQVSKEQFEARHPDVIIRTDDVESFNRPGPRLLDAVDHMYELIYGQSN